MTSLALTFNNVTFNPVEQNDGQIWLTSSELSKALGYADNRSVSKIFQRNESEFTAKMTTVVKLTTNGINNSKRQIDTRIFSLRGCHLIGDADGVKKSRLPEIMNALIGRMGFSR